MEVLPGISAGVQGILDPEFVPVVSVSIEV